MVFSKWIWMGALLLAGASCAQAQVGIFATVTGERLNGLVCLDPQNTCAANSGTTSPYGGTFGAQYDFRDYGRVRVGFDVRASVLNANKRGDYYAASSDALRHYSFLGGVRGSIGTPIKVLRPYAVLSAGLGRANIEPGTTASALISYQNFTQVQAFVGADLKLFPIMDFRVIEFGAGEMFGPSSHSIQSIGAGVVFHSAH